MTLTRLIVLVTVAAGSTAAVRPAQAQQPGITRTDLQRHDLDSPGRRAVQGLVEFAPGAEFPRHSHPGEELAYMVEGELEYRIDGRAPVTLKAGEVLFIPSRALLVPADTTGRR